MTVGDLLKKYKENEEIACVCQEEEWTYKKLFSFADSIARILSHQKILSAVGIFLPNCNQYIAAYFGITLSQHVIVPIRHQVTFPEIKKVMDNCGLQGVITDSDGLRLLQRSSLELTKKLYVLNIDTFEELFLNDDKEFWEPMADLSVQDEKAPALLLQTSGTTSDSKVVVLTHKNLLSNVQAVAQSLELTEKDRTLIQMPLALSSGNIQMLTHIAVGAACIISAKPFSPKRYFSILKEQRITNCCCVPFILQSLLRQCDLSTLQDLRFLGVGATKTPAYIIEEALRQNQKLTVVNFYGQTEASPRISHMFIRAKEKRLNSVGKALPGVEAEIRDHDNRKCKPNEKGLIFVKGDNVMAGYLKNEEATSRALIEGWLNTGDIGYKDEEGYLYIVGREKNLIISSGCNIYPEEVEEVLGEFPGVVEAYVYGSPHPFYQEIPEAKIVTEGSVDIKALYDYCKNKLSGYKIPHHIYICKEIEKTLTGKIIRKRDKEKC